MYNVTEYIAIQFPEVRTINDHVKAWLEAMESDTQFSNYHIQRPPPGLFGL